MEITQNHELNSTANLMKNIGIKRVYINTFRGFIGSIFNVLLLGVSLYIGYYFNQSDVFNLASFMLIPLFIGNICTSTDDVFNTLFASQLNFESMKRIFEIINTSSNLRKKHFLYNKKVNDSTFKQKHHDEKSDYTIIVENVFYQYENGKGLTVPISFKAKKGEIVYIFGHIGAGKSTLIKLIIGLLDIVEGNIIIDGKRRGLYSSDIFYDKIAYVEQNPTIFNLSIKDNITLNQEFDEEHLNEVLQITGLNRVIATFDKGINTIIGSKDCIQLSGGQTQLLCLSRALYKNAPILILDEFSSALDCISTKRIKKILTKIQRLESFSNKTILIVSHDESFADLANTVVTISK